MDLIDLVTEPKLVKVSLDNEVIVKKYGEAIDFYAWDQPSLESYMELIGFVGKEEGKEKNKQIAEFVKLHILDKDGKPMFKGKAQPPAALAWAAVNKLIVLLGN
jgi:hypothetical protein